MVGFVEVFLDISAKALERPFLYQVPEALKDNIRVGSVVTIPFGNGNHTKKGFVTRCLETAPKVDFELKSIISVASTLHVEGELLALAQFLSNRYAAPFQTCLSTMLPVKTAVQQKFKTTIRRTVPESTMLDYLSTLQLDLRMKKRQLLAAALTEHAVIELDQLNACFQGVTVTKKDLKPFIELGFITLEDQSIYDVTYDANKATTPFLESNPEQTYAVARITEAMTSKDAHVFLLHGKTGTGKTEVYMQVMAEALAQGKTCLVLIPEIGLTPQTVDRFQKRFGNRIGVMHSRLSKGERYQRWLQIKNGDIPIVLGPRSAIFAPLANIGVILIDESHETTYKSETEPKYHAREVAIKRAHDHGCPVVLGTATPLIESYYKALNGKYHLLKLTKRFSAEQKIAMAVVDMRTELEAGHTDIFSRPLITALKERLKQGQQSILFINRRGHSRFVSCRKCGHVMQCKHCEMAYTYHSKVERLICHHCGRSSKMVQLCPNCGSHYIKTFGVGTQQVENRLKDLFPQAKVARMDLDTTAGKDGHAHILSGFDQGDFDILVGTQMIAKGHHFPNVTLVGIVAADLSLYTEDFRAAEKTFQLISQVSGRAGRGDQLGLSIIQTYTPEHKSIRYALQDDYEGFYQDEIQVRQLLFHPPFSELLRVMIIGEPLEAVEATGLALKAGVLRGCEKTGIEVLGPTPSSLPKIGQNHRYQLLFKGKSYRAVQNLAIYINDTKLQYLSDKMIKIGVDINPMT